MFSFTEDNDIPKNGGPYLPPTHIGIGLSKRKIIDVDKLDLTTSEGLKDYIDYKFQKLEDEIATLRGYVDKEYVTNDEFCKQVEELERGISSAKSMALLNG